VPQTRRIDDRDRLARNSPRPKRRGGPCDLRSLLERVFKEDILQCASCGGRRKVTAFIPSGPLAREILERLGVDAAGPPIAKARVRPHQEHFDLHPEDTGVDPQYPVVSRTAPRITSGGFPR
jgi:hypothetical protein